jgi:hypothetical protein
METWLSQNKMDQKINIHITNLPPHEKGGGKRKDSRRITMSVIAAIRVMNPIGEGGGAA